MPTSQAGALLAEDPTTLAFQPFIFFVSQVAAKKIGYIPDSGEHEHTCGIRGNGTLCCWGTNHAGQLGNPAAGSEMTIPFRVYAPANVWAEVSVGYRYTCGVQYDGTLWCWGKRKSKLGLADQLPDPSVYP